MIIPLVLGALGLVALLASNKKPTGSAAASDSLGLLPQGLNGMAKQALATNDPQTLNTAADALDAQGFHEQATLLRQTAAAASGKGGNAQLPETMKVLMAQALSALTVDGTGKIVGPVTAQGIQIASAASAQLRAAGFKEAADSLDVFITRAQAVVPPPTPDKQLPLPGMDPALAAQVNQAIATVRDPAKLRQLIAILKGLPSTPQTSQAITTLTALADQLDAAIAAAQAMQQISQVTPASPGQPQPAGNVNVIPSGPIPVPSVPVPGQLPAAKSKQQILAESVASGLVRLQNAAAGNVKKVQGKEDKASVTRFQAQEKLTQDGKAGPGTLLAMAKYTGALPLVMYWPQKSNAQSVFAYRAKLQDLADAADAAGNAQMGSDLRASAAAERGQGGIVGTMPA